MKTTSRTLQRLDIEEEDVGEYEDVGDMRILI